MKVSDYIVEFLIKKSITDVFGYPGGMVTHLMDSFSKYESQIKAHVCYHEQAASFAACGYAQCSNKMGVAYATSGPGATNMMTGICNAYFDSIPVMFITGQVNSFEAKGSYRIRQRGFQETNIVDMAKNVTKYAVYIENAEMVESYLAQAYQIAMNGRKGPVLLDIPMDVQRAEMNPIGYQCVEQEEKPIDYSIIIEKLHMAKRPCIVMGGAMKGVNKRKLIRFANHMEIPVVTSMIAMDLLPYEYPLHYGYIGAYGMRTANFIVAKSDFLLVLGSRMDVRQVGGKRSDFAPNATILRVDIDDKELAYHIREDEIDIQADVNCVMDYLLENYQSAKGKFAHWIQVCDFIETKLKKLDDRKYNQLVCGISQYIPEYATITTDVGQNQVWVAQSFRVKAGQKILFSGGHGAMGYSLPAAIGAYYVTRKPVFCFSGDGGIQMNIQELEFVKREKLPIKIFVFNNYALGMIRHFQEMYFENNYSQTVSGKGYEVPNFEKIAKAYGIPYIEYSSVEDVGDNFMEMEGPVFVEIKLKEDTYVFPKLEFGKPNQDQEPLIDRKLYRCLMELDHVGKTEYLFGGGEGCKIITFVNRIMYLH